MSVRTKNLKRRDWIVKALVLTALLALTALLILLTADGRLFGREADDAFDTIYSVSTGEPEDPGASGSASSETINESEVSYDE